MAHLLEHLIFKGSKNFVDPARQFKARGFEINGTTWLDRTNYYLTFPASEDNLKWALAWSADAMVNSFIARKDLDSEMSVVRNEFEMGENDPASVMLKRMQSMLFRLAQLRQQHDRRAQRHRERQNREPAGFLPEVLPARQRRPDGGRQVRRAAGAQRDCRHLWQAAETQRVLPNNGRSSRRPMASASS
jgi:hypothetical protein